MCVCVCVQCSQNRTCRIGAGSSPLPPFAGALPLAALLGSDAASCLDTHAHTHTHTHTHTHAHTHTHTNKHADLRAASCIHNKGVAKPC